MDWNIQQFMVCPESGTMYSQVLSARNLRLILWCKGDYFLRQGSVLCCSPFGIVVNGKIRQIEVLHAFPYSPSLWDSLQGRSLCPGNGNPVINQCSRLAACVLQRCPYDARPD